MDTSKEKNISQLFFDKGENASQATASVNIVYGSDTVGYCVPNFHPRIPAESHKNRLISATDGYS